MYDTRIAYISYTIPETRMAVTELLKNIPDKDIPAAFSGRDAYAAFLKEELNVSEIRVEEKQDDHMMLTNTVEKLFLDDIIEPEAIDLILLAQEHEQRQKENLGQYIQHEFDLDNAYVVNISGNHCANVDYALTLGSNMARKNDRINNILVLGNVKITNPADRLVGSYGVLSDASGAMLIRKESSGWGLRDSRIISAGRLHNVDLNRDDSLLLCKYYVKCMQELLEQSEVTATDITHVVTQNANPLLVTQCLQAVGIDQQKLFSENSHRYGHMDCLDFMVNLKDLTAKLSANQEKGLILTFGTGWAGSFITSLLDYN